MRWVCGTVCLFLLAGCATYKEADYEKVSLSETTVEDIEALLDEEKPEEALQYLKALENEKITITKSVSDSLFQEAVSQLTEDYLAELEDEDYYHALSKFRSLRTVGADPPEKDLREKDLLLLSARQYIDEGDPLSGLTLFQRIITKYQITPEKIGPFINTALEEKNSAVLRQIRDELSSQEAEIPEALSAFLAVEHGFTDMIQGTVTIWVNRGIKVESGVGYPDRVIGSGFFIDKRGYLLTNYHVISSEVDPEYEGFSRLYIKMSDDPETKMPAKVIGYDRIFDIALLKVEVAPDFVFSLSDERDFLPGEQLFAIGSPVGLENTVTSGIVSARGRRFLQLGDAIQVDVPVNAGNSGGPLIDSEGKLVGVIFAGIEQFEGINFAIPAYWVHLILPKLYSEGEVIHPWLGAAVKEHDEGLEIVYVLPGEAASSAGLRQGDILLSFNGTAYTGLKEIQYEIISHSPNTLVAISWKRDEKEMNGYFNLRERPYRPMDVALKRDTVENLVVPLFGMKLEETDSVFWRPNYTVQRVYKGSIADETGLTKDDPVSIQRWKINEEYRVAILQLYVMKRTAGFLERAVQLAAYLEIDTFI